MQQKKLIQVYKKYLPVFLVGIFSFFINYHYGFVGVMPMDSFVLYNGGYRVLNGYIPFNDYWLVTGPLLDYLNAFFFLINGTNWKSFIIHSSLFNLIISIICYLMFVELGLQKKFSTIYSIFFSILFYPVVGTPFVDHHSTFFLILMFCSFIFGVVKNNNLYFIFMPILFILSFLSKQTPAVYGFLGVLFLLVLYLFYDLKKNIKILTPLIFGSIISILFLFAFFYFTEINITNFYEQYILYAKTIGDSRFSTYEFDLFGTILEYKFILILLIFLIFILKKLWKHNDIKIIFTIIPIVILSSLLIFHQYYTLNQNYIFFLIPLITGIIHVFYKKTFKNKFILLFIFLICIFSTTKYHIRFNEHRKFNELEKVDLSKAIDAGILTKDLSGLKWITLQYPNNPEEEIRNIKEAMKIISMDKTNKTIITDYQFLAPALKIYDYSPNQWHHPTVSFPLKNQKYHEKYKNFFIESLKINNINTVYEISKNKDFIIELIINKDCLEKSFLSTMTTKFKIKKECKDF